MKIRTALVPRGQLSYYRVGFEGTESTPNGEHIRTVRTIAIDVNASTVTKEVVAGEEY